jgi:tRNA (cmo5U34)-methyltransferase
MTEKDTLYRDGALEPDGFRFDRRVVRVFPDMIRRSVPGYGLIVPSIALLARRHVRPGSRIYDLGCSLGAVSLAILDALAGEDAELVAVDNSREMIERFSTLARERRDAGDPGRPRLRIEHADILDVKVEDASVVVLNFTLQFIEPALRDGLLKTIASGMRPGGLLVLSEKIRFADGEEQQRLENWHLDFKRAQGYSELEIARKRDALEKTLVPESMETHLERLKQAGFGEAWRWFQCFNFASIAAIR